MDLITAALEQFGITVTAGSSVVAIVFYFYSLCNKLDESCSKLQYLVYKIIRVGMVLLGVIFTFNLVLGVLDSNFELMGEYGLKMFVLITVAVSAVLMTKHILPSKFLIPVPVAAWTFISFFHFAVKVIGVNASSTNLFLFGLLFYLLFTSFIYLLFFLGRHYCK